MIRIILHGCNGRVGRMITSIIASDDRLEIVAGVDKFDEGTNKYPVYNHIENVVEQADVIIDFSNAQAVDNLLDFAVAHKLPLVLCTTGLSPEQVARVQTASESIAILRSANMSIGVNLLLKLVREASGVLEGAGFNVEIVEKHHKHKLDAPSGTALALADAAAEGMKDDYEYVYDRSMRRMERPSGEIGISAVRGGSIVGDHDVIFAGEDEVITISHTAYSRAIFAKGAIEAARYLSSQPAGMYSMSDVIG